MLCVVTQIAKAQPDTTLIAQPTSVVAADPANITVRAEQLYNEGQYADALSLFETLTTSPEALYNAGNCHYKLGDLAYAILYYERALLLDPSDEDVRSNLALVQGMTVDKLDNKEYFLLKRWFDQLRDLQGERAWSYTTIALFSIFLIGAFLFFFGKVSRLKQLGFYGALLTLLLFIFSMTLASSAKDKLTERNRAVITSATITLRSSPDKSGTELFILHEGTVVSIESSLSGWLEIELRDGRVGWVEESHLVVI